MTWAGAWIIVLASGADIAGPSQARSSGPGVIFHDPPRSAHLSHPLGKRLCTPFPRPQCRGLRAWPSSDEYPAGPGKRCAFPGEMYAPVEGHGPLVRVPEREARSSPSMCEGDREAVEWVNHRKPESAARFHPFRPSPLIIPHHTSSSHGDGGAGIRGSWAHRSAGWLRSPGPSLRCGRGMTGLMRQGAPMSQTHQEGER